MGVICTSILFNLPLMASGRIITKKHYARTGICKNIVTGAKRCALTPSDCEPKHVNGVKNINGEKWFSAYGMNQMGHTPCICDTTQVGACFAGKAALDADGADLSFRCAATPKLCDLSQGETFDHVNDLPLENDAQCG